MTTALAIKRRTAQKSGIAAAVETFPAEFVAKFAILVLQPVAARELTFETGGLWWT